MSVSCEGVGVYLLSLHALLLALLHNACSLLTLSLCFLLGLCFSLLALPLNEQGVNYSNRAALLGFLCKGTVNSPLSVAQPVFAPPPAPFVVSPPLLYKPAPPLLSSSPPQASSPPLHASSAPPQPAASPPLSSACRDMIPQGL